MPNYDYQCLACGNNFEVFQKMTDPVLKSCPKCKGKVRRLFGSGAGLIFKGSGFYATDYKKQTSSSEKKKETPSACSGCKEAPSCSKANKE